MANGRSLYEQEAMQPYFAASWDADLGSLLKVCLATDETSGSHQPKVCVVVEVVDRGPSRRLYKQGRILDLSKKSFAALADLKEGVIEVEIEEVK